MLERIKKALVESFVGVLLVGSLFTASIMSLIGGISMPAANWLAAWVHQQNTSVSFPNQTPLFLYEQLIREGITAALFFLIAFLLLRWLYMEPVLENSNAPEKPEEST